MKSKLSFGWTIPSANIWQAVVKADWSCTTMHKEVPDVLGKSKEIIERKKVKEEQTYHIAKRWKTVILLEARYANEIKRNLIWKLCVLTAIWLKEELSSLFFVWRSKHGELKLTSNLE